MSINQKSGRQTFRRRFASGSLFVSPCPPECYLQSETKIEPDLKLDKALLFFSVKERIQTLKFPFKPLRCCLRNDKLVNCHVRKFCKDLTFAHVPYYRCVKIFHAWFDLSNLSVSFLILLRSLWVRILKQLFFAISVNSGFRNIYRLGKFISHYCPRFQRIIVNYSEPATPNLRKLRAKSLQGLLP